MNWIQKLSSRKLWAALAGLATGLAMVFGADEGTISSIAGAVVSAASLVAYIVTEGRIDAAWAKAPGAQERTGPVPSVDGAGAKSAEEEKASE